MKPLTAKNKCLIFTSESNSCVDNDVACDVLAKKNFCRKKAAYMQLNCRRTCKFCTEVAPTPGELSYKKFFL